MERYDAIIIGAGTAGQTAAYQLAEQDLRLAVIEASDTPGGVCALHGCQAKKWFYEVAETMARCRHLVGLGITTPPQVSWREILAAKNKFTAAVPDNTVKGLRASGIDFVSGRARFLDPQTLTVEDRKYTADHFVIATGAEPVVLPIEGFEHLATSTQFLDLQELPARIVFVGGGFISFEFAHFAARLGPRNSELHIVESSERPLKQFDADLVKELLTASGKESIEVHTGSPVTRVDRSGGEFRVTLESGKELQADLVVHGGGRRPLLDNLNLDEIGVTTSGRGIKVNARMQSSLPHIYAVGDCADTIMLARVADQEAMVAATNIAGDGAGGGAVIDYTTVPSVLFTYPQLAMVGKTEAQLQDASIRYWQSSDTGLSWPTYRRVGLRHAGYKILVDSDDRILGAHILSDNSSGLINTFRMAMQAGMTLRELRDSQVMSPYPSRESDILYMLDSLLA